MSLARLVGIAALACALPWVLPPGPASGKDDSWPVKGHLIGKGGKKAMDVSGIACTRQSGFPRSCLVIDDNRQDAQFVEVRNGKLVAGDTISLIDDKFKKKRLELDGEGVAFSGGFYYVIGSHGHPRDSEGKLDPVADAEQIKARIAASSQIVRFRAKDGTGAKPERTAGLRTVIAADPGLAPFMDRRLDDNGLTIEGIAIMDAMLFAGFRGPVLDNGSSAAVLSVSLEALFDGGNLQRRLFRLPLGAGRGVRDLAVFEKDILILAGPVASGPGTYAVYAWDGASENVRLLSELTQFAPKRKPEGLLPLDRNGTTLRALIIFDSDEEGTPTPIEVPAP